MKTIFVAVTLCLIGFSTYAGEREVHRDSSGYYIIHEESENTGIKIEEGLNLTRKELSVMIDDDKKVPFDTTVRFAGWNDFTHLQWERVSKGYIELEDGVIRKVEQGMTETEEVFNLFFILAAMYILFLSIEYALLSRGKKTSFLVVFAAFATFAAFSAFGNAAAVASDPAAFATAAAAFAAAFAFIEGSKKICVMGISFMLISAVFMYNI